MYPTIVTILENVFDSAKWKLLASTVVAAATFLFGVADFNIIIGMVFLVFGDFALGVAASHSQGQEITPKQAFRSPLKLLVYGVMVAGAHIIDGMVLDTGFVEQSMVVFLSITEFISILRNAGLLGFAIPQKVLNLAMEIQTRYE